MGQGDKEVTSSRIALEAEDRFLALATFNRPDQRNPIAWSTVKSMRSILEEFAKDETVRVIAITGTGPAFSAGGDLKAYLELQRDEVGFMGFLKDFHGLCNYIQFEVPKPVIALVNGVTSAGGTEIMLACDFAYAAQSAKIGDAHLNFGQMGGGGVLARLPRQINPNFAREILFTGKFFAAEECLGWGLVNRVVPDDQLLEAGLEFANIVATKSPLAVQNMKQVCNRGLTMRFEDALLLEMRVTHHYCLTSHDSYEGLQAFAMKRKPLFTGK
jgi:enoyl-CoA hydratase/carnithine racemase